MRDKAKSDSLIPILVTGGGRSGSTQIMWLLGTDPRVKFDREFPYENRYLTYFTKLALMLQTPDLLQFFDPQQLGELEYLGFGGYRPGPHYVSASSPYVYLPREGIGSWLRTLWGNFCRPILQQAPESEFYGEKVPLWVAPQVRKYLQCFTIYNVRDPRDMFLSTNAFMKKNKSIRGFGRSSGETDYDYARRLAQAFLNTFDNYYLDRNRSDTLLVRYEDYVLNRHKVANELQRVTGVMPRAYADEPYVGSHATSSDVTQSVNRWTREPIASDILGLLEGLLHLEMTTLGYTPSLSSPVSPNLHISFANGQIKLRNINHSSHGKLQPGGDYAVVQVGGPDFHIFLPGEPFEAAQVKEVWVSVSGEIGDIFSLYWRRRDAQFSESSSMHVAYAPSPHWSILTFLVHTHPEWTGTIKSVRLDLFNSHHPRHRGMGLIRWVRFVQ